MTKEEFLISYVLARAAAKPDAMGGEAAAAEAIAAWRTIQTNKDKS